MVCWKISVELPTYCRANRHPSFCIYYCLLGVSVLADLMGRKTNAHRTTGFQSVNLSSAPAHSFAGGKWSRLGAFCTQCAFRLSRLDAWLLFMIIGRSLKGVEPHNQEQIIKSGTNTTNISDLSISDLKPAVCNRKWSFAYLNNHRSPVIWTSSETVVTCMMLYVSWQPGQSSSYPFNLFRRDVLFWVMELCCATFFPLEDEWKR